MSGSDTTKPVCIRCGQPAVVTVMHDDASSVTREYCLRCADERSPAGPTIGRLAASFVPRLLTRLGVLVGVLALLADYLDIPGRDGFGWKQIVGFQLGVVVLTLGTFLRAGVLTVGGMLLVILSLGADYLGVGHSAGLGWKQTLAIPLCVACVVAGVIWERRKRGAASHDHGAVNAVSDTKAA